MFGRFHECDKLILEYRKYQKLASLFCIAQADVDFIEKANESIRKYNQRKYWFMPRIEELTHNA